MFSLVFNCEGKEASSQQTTVCESQPTMQCKTYQEWVVPLEQGTFLPMLLLPSKSKHVDFVSNAPPFGDYFAVKLSNPGAALLPLLAVTCNSAPS